MDLSKKVAIVTGSGRGIGRAIALKLAEVGATVVVNDIGEYAQGVAEEIRAMNAALNDLSLKCNPTDAHRALYLLCAPPEKINMELLGELGNSLRNVAREAVIRSGDYPRSKRSMDVTIVLSELRNVARITDFFNRVIGYIIAKRKQKGIEAEQLQLEDAFKDIPTLI